MASIKLKGDTSGEITIKAPSVAGTNTVTLTANTGELYVSGGTEALKIPVGTTSERPTSPETGMVRYNTTTGTPEWYDSGSSNWIQFNKSAPYSVDYLVVAGGGSGGGHAGSGGGAGGYRTSFGTGNISGGNSAVETALQVQPDTVYTITIGAGGASRVNASGYGGGNSTIATSGVPTVTALSGAQGRGGATTGTGFSGGSGSGGAGSSGTHAGGAGTSGHGHAGGNNSNNWGTGGGGGAGAVGGNGSGSNAGNGGAGLASSITGSSVTRAGGGGGSSQTGTHGTGGAGGGGNGSGGTAGAGSANTGGGGGGSHGATTASGAGGSGVVILRMPTAKYSGITTGSPSVTTSGSDTILTFTSSGTYTG